MKKIKNNNLYLCLVFISFISMANNTLAKDEEKVVKKSAKIKTYNIEEVNKMIKSALKRRLRLLKKGEFVKFTNELFEKEKILKLSEIKIKKKEGLLENSKKSLQKQIIDFRKEQKRYLGCRDKVTSKKDKRILHMVEVISGMKPINASKILEVQDAKIAIDILSKLEAVKVSKIFNLMDKEISARLQKQYIFMQE